MRSEDEWRRAIGTTLENVPMVGEIPRETWGMIMLLSQIAFILLEIRELLRQRVGNEDGKN